MPKENRSIYGQYLSGGWERRVTGDAYDWDGLKRFPNGSMPYLVYQHTLSGTGEIRHAGQLHTLTADQSFLVSVPSDHHYRLPGSSPYWAFFYLSISHPYVVERLGASVGPVLLLGEEYGALVALKALHVLEVLTKPPLSEPCAEERALFDWMLQVEASAFQQRYPGEERKRLLDDLRAQVLRRLSRPPQVEELAHTQGKSRSLYSHDFRRITGRTPAETIREIRLQEVKRLLLQANDTLDSVAAATGFADANHLCKAFRRAFGLSPGAFRRQSGVLQTGNSLLLSRLDKLVEPLKSGARAADQCF